MRTYLNYLLITIFILALGCTSSNVEIGQLKKEFKNPPKEFTVMPFWFLNGDLNEKELTRQMEDFVAHHVYGLVLHPRMGLSREVGYLTPRWFELIKHITKEAERLEMKIILYDEGMYPSGSAMGKVVESNQKFASQGIAIVPQTLDKSGKYSFSINDDERVVGVVSAKETNNGTVEAGTSKYLGKELSGIADNSNVVYLLKQTPTGGMIRGVHFGEDTDNLPHDNPPPSADLLNPDATGKFIELTHDQYYNAIGSYFGNVVLAMFTDEPSIMGRNRKRGVKPWTWDYEFFLSDYSPNLKIENIPLLFFESTDGLHIKVRSDYKLAEAEKLNETFYEPLSEWCESHGIALTGHPHGANEITPQKYFGIPGQDVVLRWILPDSTALECEQSMNAKSASSAGRNWDRRLIINECFGAYQMRFNTDEMKWLSDWLLVRGINRLSPHAFYYSIEGPRFYERPPDVGANNLWWEHYNIFSDYASRVSWLNTDNKQVCEVAVYSEHNQYGFLSAKVMFQNQIDFNYIDETVRDATNFDASSNFKNEKVQIGTVAYSTIILDGLTKLSDKGVDFLEKCSDGGINIILFSQGKIEGLESSEINYTQCKTETELKNLLHKIVPKDVISIPHENSLRVSHIIKGDVDFYFCVNENEDVIDCQLSIPVIGKAEYWDAENGLISDCPIVSKDGNRISVPLKLYPRQSIIIAVNKNEKVPDVQAPVLKVKAEYVISGKWTLITPNKTNELKDLNYWTDFPEYENFSGTMTYKVVFDVADDLLTRNLTLDLGMVKEFATVVLNKKNIGTRLWRPFHFEIAPGLLSKGNNVLEISVTNSLANEFGKQWLPSGLSEEIKLIAKGEGVTQTPSLNN
jgi:hypothetical protein